jgi:hypothetical protein
VEIQNTGSSYRLLQMKKFTMQLAIIKPDNFS